MISNAHAHFTENPHLEAVGRHAYLADFVGGLDLPVDYPIANGEQPIVVAKVSMNDLIVIENEEPHGAAVNARKRNFGENCARAVDISDFSEN